MNEVKMRHEQKYLINLLEQYELDSKLKLCMKKDENAVDQNAYRVKSLYFDNYNDRALLQKVNGLKYHEKFRLRLYNNDKDTIRLEKKIKVNGLCGKQIFAITREQCEQLLAGNSSFLKEAESPLALEFYCKLQYEMLKPRCVIEYNRRAYTYPVSNTRVTIDDQIRTSLFVDSFLKEEPLPIPIRRTVLEIKYDEFLPENIRQVIQLRNQRSEAFSKYTIARTLC